MRVLATIPDLGAVAETEDLPSRNTTVASEPAPVPAPCSRAPAPSPRAIRRRPRPSFPWVSVAALGLVAFLAWSLAGWNDGRRLARQQAEERMAQVPARAATAEGVLR